MLARRCIAFVFALDFLLLSAAASAQDVQPAQTIEVLVTTAPGAPTADDLVTYYRGQPLTPPLTHNGDVVVRREALRWNHLVAFGFLVCAAFFAFHKCS